jgi:hypothetical protein
VTAAFPGRAHLHQLLAQLGYYDAVNTTLSQCDWAACKQLSCLSLSFDLILSWDVVCGLAWYPIDLYPVFNRTETMLDHLYSMMQMAI